MGQTDAQLLGLRGYLCPAVARVGNVVDVVHGEATGYGQLGLALSVHEDGMRGEYGQAFLVLGLELFKLITADLSAAALLQSIRYGGTRFVYFR